MMRSNRSRVTAGMDAERRFTLEAAAGYAFSFSDDTSGALTALGVNTFFDGSSAGAVTALLGRDAGKLSDEDLDRIEALIRSARREGGPKGATR